MARKYSELAYKFREKVNENMFLCTQYSARDKRNLWNCICSAMDWIDVGICYIENFTPPVNEGLSSCMSIFTFIQSIDIVRDAVIKLRWVLFNDGLEGKETKSPFYKSTECFAKSNLYNLTDDKFFIELRACCGAHPVSLDTKITDDDSKHQFRYSSWIRVEDDISFDFCLYSNNAENKDIYVKTYYSELIKYFEMYLNYLECLIKQIDKLYNNFKNEAVNNVIPKSDNPIEQLSILKEANENRLNNQCFDETIEQLFLFFKTDFANKNNENVVKRFEKNLVHGIDELYNNIQNLEFYEMTLDKLLNPPIIGVDWFGYEYAAISEQVLTNIYKPFQLKVLTEPLKKHVDFEGCKSLAEIYWLIVIALNIVDENTRR